jgi:cytochrome b
MGSRSIWLTREGVMLIAVAVVVAVALIWGLVEASKEAFNPFPPKPPMQKKEKSDKQPQQPLPRPPQPGNL